MNGLQAKFVFFFFSFVLSVTVYSKNKEKNVLLSPYSYKDIKSFSEALEGDFHLVSNDKESVLNSFLLKFYLPSKKLSLVQETSQNLTKEIKLYSYYLEKIPVCNRQLKVVQKDQLIPLILGGEFSLDQKEEFDLVFPRIEETEDLILKFAADLHPKTLVKKSTLLRKCYYYDGTTLVPSVEMRVNFSGKPYKITLSKEKIVASDKLFFHLESSKYKGEIQAWEKNALTTDLKIFKITFDGTGYLSNSLFSTYLDSGAPDNLTKAYSKDFKFIYDPEEPHFPEASLFAHVTDMYKFFLNLGYKEWHIRPFVIRAYSVFKKDKNNAMYLPYDDDFQGAPTISVGEGDGLVLENLLVDSDVVSHELSHHVVFETLTTTKGSSLAIHEGLADYFAFAKANDPCLGETICPSSSLSCYIYNQCLRTAQNDLIYSDEMVMSFDWHTEGQILSGTLWELRADIGAKLFDKLVLRSIGYFISDMDYYGFIHSLLRADEVETKGKNRCRIYDAFVKRGFTLFLSELSCENIANWPEPKGVSYDFDQTENEDNDSIPEEDIACGFLGIKPKGPLDKTQGLFLFMLLFSLPVLYVGAQHLLFIRKDRKKYLAKKVPKKEKEKKFI